MAEVDNKVVSLTFDNVQFQKKMQETLDSLEKLRKSLDLNTAKQSLSDLGSAANNFNMGNMAAAVEGVSAKFVGLATMGITALANLTNRAVDAGIQFTKSLTVSPVAAGFDEFELKMGSIQTIMAGSGESLETVNRKLADLNAYSDRTIYSFKDMTSNIGKFTNAGVSLDKSVSAIQGVANVAALSGANSEEASRAMYNFAQAISTGSVKLLDWKSIELANMGTTEFKQQLIDTAVEMGTLTKAGDGLFKTLEGTEVSTTKFNQTLQDGWLTSEALTATLGKFSDETTDIGKRATAAATEIKTFSQMIDTMKESVGSGWSQSFETIFGNFEEGKGLWSMINQAFGGMLQQSADARNELLSGWKELGGRDELVAGFAHLYQGVKSFILPIREAFREIFPRTTSKELYDLTHRFYEFARGLKIGEDTAKKVKTAFKGIFAVFGIAAAILKGVVRVFFALAGGIWSVITPILGLLSGSGKLTSGLHSLLVEGGGIQKFFDGLVFVLNKVFGVLSSVVTSVVNFVDELKIFKRVGDGLSGVVGIFVSLAKGIKDFFTSIEFGKGAKKGVEETGESLEKTAGLFDRFMAALGNVFSQIDDFFRGIGELIADSFQGLGGAIADALGSGNFDQVLNIIKTGLLGGILTMLVKFFKNGIKFDFGQAKLFDKIGGVLDTVTASLKSLQASIRADTLLKIAGAMGILAIAIVALSLVNAEALTKSMVAIGAGFAMMTAVMLRLEKVANSGGAIKIAAMAAGMVLLAGAMTLLVIPIKVLAGMSLSEIGKGLIGVIAGMIGLATAIRIIGSDTKGVFKAAAAMILISVALIVLAKAIKSFAEMNLAEMGWGLSQAAIGIGLLIVALNKMPDDVAKKGLGLLILAFSLRSLAKVVQLFANISIGTLAKGFIAIALGLNEIGVAMQAFPDDMVQKAAGLVIASAALYIIGKAVEQVGSIPFGDLVKGVIGLSVMLTALAAAILVMDGAKGGITGLLAGAAGLLILGMAIEQVGGLDLGTLIQGILGLAAVLAVLAVASLVAPGIFLLGVALMAVGAGLAFAGAGIMLAGKGLELFAKFGGEAMDYVIDAMQRLLKELPRFISAFVQGLVQAAIEIGNEFMELVGTIEKILLGILEAIQRVIPEIADTIGSIIDSALEVFNERVPDFVDTGFNMLTQFIRGFRDNIDEITTMVGEIIVAFLDAFADEMPDVLSSLTELIATTLHELAYNLGLLVPTLMIGIGRNFMQGLWDGVTQELGKLGQLFMGIVKDIIGFFTSGFGIFSPSKVMMEIGENIIRGLINGVKSLFGALSTLFIEIPGKVLGWIGNTAITLVGKGVDLLVGLLQGLANKIGDVIHWFTSLPGKILGWLGNTVDVLKDKGIKFIVGLYTGITQKIATVRDWFGGLPRRIIGWLGNAAGWLVGAGEDVIRGLWEGIKGMKNWLMDNIGDLAGGVIDGVKGFFGIGSPSKVFMEIGEFVGEGLIIGLDGMQKAVTDSSQNLAYGVNNGFKDSLDNNIINGFKAALESGLNSLSTMDEFNPTITPVLDLSKVQAESRKIGSIVSTDAIQADASFARARTISLASRSLADDEATSDIRPETILNFNQTINAPEALSTNDIYRSTKSQIVLAKEKLGI